MNTQTISKILNSKLLANLSYQTILYGFSHIIPLVLIPFLINTIGIEKYGIINFAIAFGFYFQVINEFGFDLSNVRHVVGNRTDKEKLSEILSTILQCKLYIILVSGIVFFSLVFTCERFKSDTIMYILVFIRMFFVIITPLWLFRSLENMKTITRVTVPVKIISILPVFFVVKQPEDYVWVMLSYTVECMLSAVIILTMAIRNYDLTIRWQRTSTIKYYLKDSLPFFSSSFITRIYQTSNTVIIGFIMGDYALGIYTTAEKLYFAYVSFVSPIISHVFYPYFQRIKDIVRINKIIITTCLCNVGLLLVLYLLMPYVAVFVLGDHSENILHYFNIFLIVLALYIPNELMGFPYMGVIGKIKEVTYSSVYAAISYFIIIGLSLIYSPSIALFVCSLLVANVVGISYKAYCCTKDHMGKKYEN